MKAIRPQFSLRHALLTRHILATCDPAALTPDERDALPHVLGRIDRELAKHGVRDAASRAIARAQPNTAPTHQTSPAAA